MGTEQAQPGSQHHTEPPGIRTTRPATPVTSSSRRALCWSWERAAQQQGPECPKPAPSAACLFCRREPPGDHSEGSQTEAAGTWGLRRQTSRFPNLGRHRPALHGPQVTGYQSALSWPALRAPGNLPAAVYTSGRRPCLGPWLTGLGHLPQEPGTLCGQRTGRRSVPERQPLWASASAPCAALTAQSLLSSSRDTCHRRGLVPPPRPLTHLPPFSLHLWLPSGVLTRNGQKNQNISKAIRKGRSQTQRVRQRPDSVHGQRPCSVAPRPEAHPWVGPAVKSRCVRVTRP